MIDIVRSTVKVEESVETLISRYVKQHKLKRLGEGAFAAAYSNGKPRARKVYKIGKIEYSNKFKDDAYINYLERVILPYQHNPLVPKVHGVQYVTLNGGDRYPYRVYVVAMERLYDYRSVKVAIRKNLIGLYGLKYIEDIDELDCIHGHELREYLARDTTGHFREIATPLRKLLRSYGSDIHEGNIMWRGKGNNAQMVITDPVA